MGVLDLERGRELLYLSKALVSSGNPRAAPNHSCLVVNLGLALEDMAVVLVLYRRALVQGIGTVLPC